jgi:hypothetical protein
MWQQHVTILHYVAWYDGVPAGLNNIQGFCDMHITYMQWTVPSFDLDFAHNVWLYERRLFGL